MLARGQWLATPGESIQGLGDLHLEEVDRHLVRALEPCPPVAQSLDCRGHDGGLGQAYAGDANPQEGSLGLGKSHEHAADSQALVRRAPGGHTEDVAEVSLLRRVHGAVAVAHLTPVAVSVDLPGELTGQDPVWFRPVPEAL